MIKIFYTPTFIKQYKKLHLNLQEETKEKIELFKSFKNHKSLKVHKLKGRLKDRMSFSVNYSYRIIFQFNKNKKIAILLAIGNHHVYNQ